MIYTPMTKKAINLMFEKHKDQKDKSGLPYVFHPFIVAESMSNELSATVALLHDIVEDTDVEIDDLEKMNFPKEVIEALRFLTHDKDMPYADYIKLVANNKIAREVKMSDLKHNMDLSRLNEVTEKDLERVEKYKRSYKYLEEHDPSLDDSFRNSFFGFVVGDALGVPVEFKVRSELKRVPLKEMEGYGSHKVPLGTWSDDTSMNLAEMDSIKEKNAIDYDDIMSKFASWIMDEQYTATGEVFDIGFTTNKAIHKYLEGNEPTECGGILVSENGNGSLMRILPFVIYSYENKLSDDEEVKLINEASSLTHAHEISRLGCKIYSDFIKEIFSKKTPSEAMEHLASKDYSKYYSSDALESYSRVLDGSIVNLEEDKISSSGFVVSTLEASLWSFYNSNNYEEAVLKAINLGDDTDTVGAITGSLAGAYYGDIPNRWLDKIKNKELAEEIYTGFINSVKKNEKSNSVGVALKK